MEFKQVVLLFLVIPIAFLILFQFIFFSFTFKSLDEFLKSQIFWSIVITFGVFIYISRRFFINILLKLKKKWAQQKKAVKKIIEIRKREENGIVSDLRKSFNAFFSEEEGRGIIRKARFESSRSLCIILITVDGIFLSILGTGILLLLVKTPNLPIFLAFIMLILSMVVGISANDWLAVVADIDDQRVYIPHWKKFWRDLYYQYHLFIIGTIYLFLGITFHFLK
jgi:hypothetical protein